MLASSGLLFGAAGLIAAVLAVVPSAQTGSERPPALFVFGFGGLVFASAIWAGLGLDAGWHSDLATALRMTLVATTGLFAMVLIWMPRAWRLWVLLGPCLILIEAIALLLPEAAETGALPRDLPPIWMGVHIAVSVLTYAAATLAAIAAIAYLLQQRALKGRSRLSVLTRRLPPLVTCEAVETRLLKLAVLVLGAGILTGTAIVWFETGSFLRFDHKTLFSVASFVLLVALLTTHRLFGVRGRTMVRMVLAAYLLLTLAYPGVKFVRQVLLPGA